MPAFKKHNDVEKGAAARDLETSDSSSSDYVPQSGAPEGGATFHDNRNITPGGHPLDRSQPAFPTYHRRFANPAPLGLSAFGLTTFMLSLINLSTRGVVVPNVVVGPAMWYGGLAQLLAGMWEFAVGNTFGATAFSSYGAFWLSYAFIVSPWSGIAGSYEVEADFASGVAFFLFGFFIFTTIMTIASIRSSVALFMVFLTVDLTFLMLGISELGISSAAHFKTAGGSLGIVAAFLAWYVAAASLITPDTAYISLPVIDLSRKD
ncbi:hypothetical protein JCM5353_002797 [Sporobolomyces roseus]